MFHLSHSTLAANDDLWRKVQANITPEVPFLVLGIPQRLLEVWSELSYTTPTSLQHSSPKTFLMFPLRLVKLREIVLARPFINEIKLVEAGYDQMREDQARNELFLQSVRKKAKGVKRRVVEENVRETRKAEEAARQGQGKVLEMQNELRLVTERQAPKTHTATRWDKGGTVGNRPPDPTWQTLMSKNPLVNARLITTRSSKLNYLLKDVRSL